MRGHGLGHRTHSTLGIEHLGIEHGLKNTFYAQGHVFFNPSRSKPTARWYRDNRRVCFIRATAPAVTPGEASNIARRLDTAPDEMERVRQVLLQLKLAHYTGAFEAAGYDDLDFLMHHNHQHGAL